jgi:hypothetical protein
MKKIKIITLMLLLIAQGGCIRFLAEKFENCRAGGAGNCGKSSENDIEFELLVPLDAPPICKEIGKLLIKAQGFQYQGARQRLNLNETTHQAMVMDFAAGPLTPAFMLVDWVEGMYEKSRKDVKVDRVKKEYDAKGCPPLLTRTEMQKKLYEKYGVAEIKK